MADALVQHFQSQAENNLWSNHRLQRSCLALDEAAYHAPRESFFGSIHETLAHILVVDQAYMARMSRGTRPSGGVRNEGDYPDRATLFSAQEACDRELIAFCQALDSNSLAEVMHFTNAEGVENADPVSAILTHLFLHQTHHRGQVHQLLSTTTAAPPQLDEFFLSGDRPRRIAELRALGLAD